MRFLLAFTALILIGNFGASAETAGTKAKPPGIIVAGAWVKPTIPGGAVSAAYMRIQSLTALKLIKVETPVAGEVQIHDMKMNDGVMEMREMDGVDIPVGKVVELKPGGKHVMLMNIAKPIRLGSKVPLKLVFVDANKKQVSIQVDATVSDRAPGSSSR